MLTLEMEALMGKKFVYLSVLLLTVAATVVGFHIRYTDKDHLVTLEKGSSRSLTLTSAFQDVPGMPSLAVAKISNTTIVGAESFVLVDKQTCTKDTLPDLPTPGKVIMVDFLTIETVSGVTTVKVLKPDCK
jgi:hypothetical protein